jgi:hypothetical protein
MVRELKEHIELRFGRKVVLQKDCIELSDSILNETGHLISSSTLRRIFGFLSTNSNPTRATLDILSQYCGYTNWSDFQVKTRNYGQSTSLLDLWFKAHEVARSISSKTIDRINKSNDSTFAVNRVFVEERIEDFLNSKYSAMAIIGPGGYGKTTLLAKWYERVIKQKAYQKDIIVFIQAALLENCLLQELIVEEWFFNLLGLPSNFFTSKPTSKPISERLILVIDSFEELETLGSKGDKICTLLHQLVNGLSTNENVKVIVSTRLNIWEDKFCGSNVSEKWFMTQKNNLSAEGANFPPLTDEEIQEILDNTINKKYLSRQLVETFSEELRQTISHPYFLQLLLNTFNPDGSLTTLSRLDLLNNFIKNQVYTTNFADEKIDLLNKIIELTDYGKKGISTIKNDLREYFPIHLKLAGNYYSAYNELLSFGIITESLTENRFGSYVKMVRISHPQIFEMLIVQKLAHMNGGVTFDLFRRIEKEYANSYLLPSLTILAFQLAYRDRNTEALTPFFSLSRETLEKVFKTFDIQMVLRKDEFMRRKLFPSFFKNETAQKFLLENFVDLDAITGSFILNIESYNKNKFDAKANFIASNLLALSGVLMLNTKYLKNNSSTFNISKPTQNSWPLVLGIWFSNRLFASYFNLFGSFENVASDLENFTNSQYIAYNSNERSEFELGLAYGLILTKKFELLVNRLSYLIKDDGYENLTPVQKALQVFLFFGNWRITNTLSTNNAIRIENNLNQFPPWCSFHPLIIGRSVLSIHYLQASNAEKAYISFRKATEISNISGYKLYEVKLLKNLSEVLVKLSESRKAQECEDFAKSLIIDTPIDYGIL